MNKMIKHKKIEYTGNIFNIDIELTNNIVIWRGNSATGKTFVCDVIKTENEMALDESFKNIKIIDIHTEEFLEQLQNYTGMLIIIDNADIILTRKLQNFINSDDKNQYIIIGRGKFNFDIPLASYGELYIDGKTIKADYKYKR